MLKEHKHIGERTKAAVPREELNGVVVVVFAVSLSCYCCVGCRPMDLCVFAYCDLLSVGCFLLVAIVVVVSRVFLLSAASLRGDTMLLTMFFSLFFVLFLVQHKKPVAVGLI